MGQSKGGGYIKKDTLSPEQMTLLQQLISGSNGMSQQAAQGFQQFLPGGGGGKAITDAANQNFNQTTLPQIMTAFGSNAKSSSALNQALAAGASNLNTDLAAQLSQMQLSAAQGLGSLGQGQASLGLNTPAFAYMQRQPPLWQQMLLAGVGAGGQLGAAALGKPSFGG